MVVACFGNDITSPIYELCWRLALSRWFTGLSPSMAGRVLCLPATWAGTGPCVAGDHFRWANLVIDTKCRASGWFRFAGGHARRMCEPVEFEFLCCSSSESDSLSHRVRDGGQSTGEYSVMVACVECNG